MTSITLCSPIFMTLFHFTQNYNLFQFLQIAIEAEAQVQAAEAQVQAVAKRHSGDSLWNLSFGIKNQFRSTNYAIYLFAF